MSEAVSILVDLSDDPLRVRAAPDGLGQFAELVRTSSTAE